ncbi:MAG TPA: SulP family inorganic anion transporter [Candidatus Binatia bacterium]|nr:SulP family inorganic anion transporter [Candidatus Binatia bacterium]
MGLLPSLAGLDRQTVLAEAVAGATLAAVAIPESMGYTRIAGMPPITGLYTLALPVIVFALIGSSRHLVVGADSATAAIMFAALTGMGIPVAGPEWIGLAGVIALLAALYLVVARLLRLGFLADFLSRTALVGFLTGVGIQVALTQLPAMLGIRASGSVIDQVGKVLTHLGSTVPPDVLLAVAAVVALFALGAVAERIPGALLVVAASIALTAVLGLDRHGVAIVGSVKSGFPIPKLPANVTWSQVPGLAAVSASIFVVILAQSAATARSFAQKHHEELSENRDLLGLAVANLAAGFSGTFCVNGSPTKTAVVDSAGGRTQLAELVMAAVTIVILVVATGLLHFLPDATLAAVVFVIGVRLIDVRHLRELWRLRRDELAVATLTALVVVLIGVEAGIGLAVALSVLDFVRRAYRPRDSVVVLGSGAEAGITPQPARPGLETVPGGIVYRFDGALFFANADHFRQRVLALVAAAPHPVTWLIFDLSPVADIDYTGGKMLTSLLRDLKGRPVSVYLAHCEDIVDVLQRYGIVDLVGPDHVHHGIRDALRAATGSVDLAG